MSQIRLASAFLLIVVSCRAVIAADAWTVKSPSGRLQTKIEANDGLRYSVTFDGDPLVSPSQIDLKVQGVGWLARQAGDVKSATSSKSETIRFPVPRKYRERTFTYNELRLELANAAQLVIRVYDDGLAYRWETRFPTDIKIDDELAEFRFPGKPRAWFPEEESMFSHQERIYKNVALTDVGSNRFCSTGTLVDLLNGKKVFISESDLRSYPGMFLRGVGNNEPGLVGKFAGYPLETHAEDDRNTPVTKAAPYLAATDGTRTFPWRAMIVSEHDTELLQSELIYALAPPQAIEDTSWIKPGKVVWEWWNGIDLTGVDFRAGVNTATYKYFIDFAAEFGIEYVLLDEGWTATTLDVFHETPDIDLPEILRYAKEKHVGVILWVLWSALDKNMDAPLDRFERLGVAGIKVDFIQRDDQKMIEFYHRVASEAAKRHLLVDFHGACKPTGLNRTYPNVMTSEGVNGLEQYKWGDERTNPEQELVLPFIRMVAGPMDYTPGAMSNANRRSYRWNVDHPMSQGTRCHQLAMYVVYESPLQMLADSPTRYRQEPACMEFLTAVPTVWDDTIAIDAKVSDYVVIARCSGADWFIGAMTDWDHRSLEVKLDFLPAGQYRLEAWADGVNADRNGQDFARSPRTVSRADKLKLDLAPGGGWVGRLIPNAQANISP